MFLVLRNPCILDSRCFWSYEIPVFWTLDVFGLTKSLIFAVFSTRHVTSCNILILMCQFSKIDVLEFIRIVPAY